MRISQLTTREPAPGVAEPLRGEVASMAPSVESAPPVTWAAIGRRRRSRLHRNSFSDLLASLS